LLNVAKVSLVEKQQSPKAGDIINIVAFATNADIAVESHRPIPGSLAALVNGFGTTGSTEIGIRCTKNHIGY